MIETPRPAPEDAPTTAGASAARQMAKRMWQHVRPETPFYLAILGLVLLTLATMSGWGRATAKPVPLPAGVRQTKVRTFALPVPNAGLMFPVADQQGNLWWGEMLTNHLSRLNPSTGKVTSWTPPGGRNNIMTIQVDSAGKIWFAEQLANYIARFDPATQQFTTYPLPSSNGVPAAPQDIVFDTQGKLWFTLLNGGAIGRLDPVTGAMTSYALPQVAGKKPLPFSLAMTPEGKVWFGLLAQGAIGVLDPSNGHVSLTPLRDATSSVFAMAGDHSGHIWFSELESPRLGMIDTTSGQMREIALTKPLGDPTSLYSIAVAGDGSVWMASSGANALVRYTPSLAIFTYLTLPRAASVPYGLAFDTHGTLWLTAVSTPDNYVGAVAAADLR